MSLSIAQNFLQQGDLQSAHRETMRIIQHNPHDLGALKVLLTIAFRTRTPLKIAQILNQINKLEPTQATRFDEALAWHQLEQPHWVLSALKQLDPGEINEAKLSASAMNLASQYDQHKLGTALAQRTVELAPKMANAHFELGRCFVFSGDFDNAKQSLSKALALHTGHPLALQLLSTLPKAYWPHELLNTITTAIQQTKELAGLKRLHEAKYRILESLGDYEGAYQAIETANNLHRQQLGPRLSDPKQKLESIMATFEQLTVTENLDSSEATPIFIVGLPRSGTTLLEQILSAHNDIEALGELPQLPAIINRAIKHAKANNQIIDSRLVAKHYFEQTAPLRGTANYFVDKMPLNYQLVGFIAHAFPTAKIILMRRDAMDVCFAQYRQIFADDARAMDYSYSLEELASYYQAFSRLMSKWDEKFPNRVFRLDYEQLVDDPTTALQSLSSYLSLQLPSQCLDLQLNQRAVSTASAGQIREPISSSHRARWRHYEGALSALSSILRKE
ncbi:tetratricopeptide repeat-containing sulfotransferase family protein [Umboniibacter marinipuniceus]|uniref:Sulfotransferase family protein n=1 Tax=Umboniibacter marinipuniceus TaxID=569599 RepID=A0A3M0ACC8_9GAMM|nr:sulfotransferase [Umboniibacter marinipuniceus]RMA82580.1 sulfotransferase family protein [Umboniibacter marinipuniceus]